MSHMVHTVIINLTCLLNKHIIFHTVFLTSPLWALWTYSHFSCRCRCLTILTKRSAVFCNGLFTCCQQVLTEEGIIFTQPVRDVSKIEGCESCCTDTETLGFWGNSCSLFQKFWIEETWALSTTLTPDCLQHNKYITDPF